MNRNIGIITMYYNSVNYGGLLQAYALCKALDKKEGVHSRQIQYNDRKLKYRIAGFVRNCQYKIKNAKLYGTYGLSFYRNNKKRKKKILKFAAEYIPHTKEIFTRKNIYKTNEIFDSFVCGSDQVWCSRDGRYYLDFANKDKYAYAGSSGKSSYNQQETEVFCKHLSDFKAVSAREKDLSEFLSDLLEKDVPCVLDPTLLLDKTDWDQVCSSRIIPEDYVFCYFLGNDTEHRKLAEKYAKDNNLKLVTLPHLQQKLTKCDIKFGQYQLYEIDPGDFISLIRYAKCVLTDSFHASVFSCIYEKKFFVFERKGHKGMSSRIHTLVDLFGCHNHFCNDEERLSSDYLNRTEPCYDKTGYENARLQSMKFIEDRILRESFDEK